MSVTTRPPAGAVRRPVPPSRIRLASPRRALALPSWGLGGLLAAAVVYAVFADGATTLPEEARLQVGIAATALAALSVLLLGRGLRLAAPRAAYAGLALLAGFAAWSGLSLDWSIAPSDTWTELNRAIAYALVAGLALLVGASLKNAVERTALGYLAIASAVAVYALGGKVFPWLNVPGVFDLNHAGDLSRLRAPLGYWNALALVCVLAGPVAVRLAADVRRRLRARAAGVVALQALLVTIVLTYSRGGIIVLAIALALLAAAGPDRARLLAATALGAIAAAPALFVALGRDDLTTDGLSVAARTDDGFLFLAALLLGAVTALLLGNLFLRGEREIQVTERARLVARQALAAGAIAVLVGAVAGLAVSDRGLTGTISHEFDQFKTAKRGPPTDPARILDTNSGNRWVWWNEAAGAWWDRPLAGHGAGSFPSLHLLYRKDLLDVKQAHSVPLQLLAETGLVGALLALGGAGLLGAAAFTRIRRAPAAERLYAVPLATAVAAWGLHMWFDWDLDIPGVTLPLLVFLGVLAARPPGRGGVELPSGGPAAATTASVPQRSLALGLGALGACAIAVSALVPSLASDRADAALAKAAPGTPKALAAAAKDAEVAKRLDPLSVDALFAEVNVAERGQRFARVSQLLAEAADRDPRNPRVWLRVASVDHLIGDQPGVDRAVAQLLRLNPRFPFPLALVLVRTDPTASATATGTPLPKAPARPQRPRAFAFPPTAPGQPPGGPAQPAPVTPSVPGVTTPPPG
jgi:O-antigen ligase/polysaccharide polymerase Wzy-like membrane protein